MERNVNLFIGMIQTIEVHLFDSYTPQISIFVFSSKHKNFILLHFTLFAIMSSSFDVLYNNMKDFHRLLDLHTALMNCDLVNEVLTEDAIIIEIAEYASGICLDCKNCGKECLIMYGDVMDERELGYLYKQCLPWETLEIDKGYLSQYYDDMTEKCCYNLYYCRRCVLLKLDNVLMCDLCKKPIMDITEETPTQYHFTCYNYILHREANQYIYSDAFQTEQI